MGFVIGAGWFQERKSPVNLAVFNRWTALHQVARVRELKRESCLVLPPIEGTFRPSHGDIPPD
jgi:hypothetical protein